MYPQEAQLFGEAQFTPAGKSVLLRFTNLSPFVQEQSIRASAGEGLTILNVSFEKNYLSEKEIGEQTRLLQNKIDSFKRQQEDIATQIRIADDKQKYLKANQTQSRLSGTAVKYREFSDYFTGTMSNIERTRLTLNRQNAELNDSIAAYNNQINQLNNNPKDPEGVILVLVNAKDQNREGKIELSYLVSRASWTPSYDIKFEGTGKALVITQKADIRQQTGSDWTNIALALSTAQTQTSADMPTLYPLTLGYVYPTDELVVTGYGSGVSKEELSSTVPSVNGDYLRDVPVSSAAEALQGRMAGVSVASEGSPDAEVRVRVRGGSSLVQAAEPLYIVDGFPVSNINDIPPSDIENIDVLKDASATAVYGAQGANGVILITTKSKNKKAAKATVNKEVSDTVAAIAIAPENPPAPPAVQFEVEEPQSLKSENKIAQVPFRTLEAPCRFSYKALPKLSEKVYLQALITDWSELELQQGEANLYFENAFIGKTSISPNSFTDTLSISFGVDQGISVKREKVKDFTETVGFGGKQQQQTVSWRISLKNNKKEAVEIEVFDQIPLTRQSDITVKATELDGGKLNETTGAVQWQVNLPAGGSKELTFTVQIKYPKDKRVIVE
ncbi:MAG: DUF4139 domain-containing protein [Prevotellaceae bacterium]|nr:DUF4139 domain-containing protein [Prevotellaceae bacterium]